MSNFGLSCDVCNRENVGITWVNGMKFCAKCYQETFGETDKDKQIAELKQQLKSQPVEIVEKIRKWGQKHYNWVGDGTGYDGQDYNECIGFNRAIDQLNEILDAILKEYQK